MPALRIFRWPGILCLALALASCVPSPQDGSTEAQSPGGVETPTPPPAPSPTTESSPTPDVPLSETGPWLVYPAQDGLAVVNDNGTGRTILRPLPDIESLPSGATTRGGWLALAPRGGWLALRLPDPDDGILYLELYHLPDGLLQDRIPLWSPEALDETALFGVFRGLAERYGMRWSPDGRYLAFVGAIEGPTLDVYVYDTQTGEVRRLTSGSNAAAYLIWSADGRWIIHQEISNFGTGAGQIVEAVWAAAPDGGAVRVLYEPPVYSIQEIFQGVTENGLLVVSTNSHQTPFFEVRLVDIGTGGTVSRLQIDTSSVYSFAFDPLDGTIAFFINEDAVEMLGAENTFSPFDLHLMTPGNPPPQVVASAGWDGVVAAPGGGRFYAWASPATIAISLDGSVTPIADTGLRVAQSPDGNWLAGSWLNTPVYLLYSTGGIVMTLEAADYVVWRPDSRGLFLITLAPSFSHSADVLSYVEVPGGEQPRIIDSRVVGLPGFGFSGHAPDLYRNLVPDIFGWVGGLN